MYSSQSTVVSRLQCIKQLLQNPETFRTAATELLDRCGDPWLFQRPVERSLMGCLAVVSRVAAQPGYDLDLGYQLMAVYAANRNKFTPDSAALVASWCEELERLCHHEPPMSSMQPGASYSYPAPCATITSDVSAEDDMDLYGPVPGNPMDKSSDPMNPGENTEMTQQFPSEEIFYQGSIQLPDYLSHVYEYQRKPNSSRVQNAGPSGMDMPPHSHPAPDFTQSVSTTTASLAAQQKAENKGMDRYGTLLGDPMANSGDPLRETAGNPRMNSPDFPGPQQQFPSKDNFNQDYMQQGTYEQPNYPVGNYSGGVTGTPSGFFQGSLPQPPSASAASTTSAMLTAQNKYIDQSQELYMMKGLERSYLGEGHASATGEDFKSAGYSYPASYPTSYIPPEGLHASPDRWLSYRYYYPQHRTVPVHLTCQMGDTPDEKKELNEEKDKRCESFQGYDALGYKIISYQLERKRREVELKESDPLFSSTFSSNSQANREQQQPKMLKHDQAKEMTYLPSRPVFMGAVVPLCRSLSEPVLDFPRKIRKEIELEDSHTPFSQDAAIVSPMIFHSSVSQQSSQHSPEQMSSDTTCDVSTTDHPVTVSLFSMNPSLELQDCCRTGKSSSLSRSHSLPSLSQIPCIENKASFRAKRSHSLNNVILVDKTHLITPDIIVVENKELYRFHCTHAGLFQCSVTGLVFKMEAEGDVTYGTVPWNGRLLAQLGKRPAGPLFDIKCLQGSVCQLHLAHCEILSAGGGKFLVVLHVMDDGVELINPHVITETHVIINVNGFSLYGVLNDEDSPNPIRTNVSLFYTPPNGDDDSTLKVLLLPQNVVMREVINARREINGEEIYIEKPPCKLIPNQEYTLSTSPQQDSIMIEPDSAAFEVYESYRNYIVTFEVMLEGKFKRVMLLLSNSGTSDCPWKACVKLSGPVFKKEQVQRTLSLEVQERMLSVRSSFIESVSLPVLNSLLDKLLEVRVITDCELEMASGMQVKNEKARFVIDIVKNKGTAASSSMLLILCDMDSCLSKHLGLM